MSSVSSEGRNQADHAKRLSKIPAFVKDWWILIAGLSSAAWVFWKFWFDISVPVNIVVNLDSRIDDLKSGARTALLSNEKQILPIKFGVTAKNISARKTLFLHNPIWVAYGTTLLAPREKWAQVNDEMAIIAEREYGHPYLYQQLRRRLKLPEDSKINVISDATKRRLEDFAYSRSLIGVGTLFGNDKLKPLEEIKAEQIIPVTRGKYDIVEVRVFVPTTDAGEDKREGLFGLIGPKVSVRTYLFARNPYDGNDNARPPTMKVFFFKLKANDSPFDEPMSKQEMASIGAQIQTSASQLWVGPASIRR